MGFSLPRKSPLVRFKLWNYRIKSVLWSHFLGRQESRAAKRVSPAKQKTNEVGEKNLSSGIWPEGEAMDRLALEKKKEPRTTQILEAGQRCEKRDGEADRSHKKAEHSEPEKRARPAGFVWICLDGGHVCDLDR